MKKFNVILLIGLGMLLTVQKSKAPLTDGHNSGTISPNHESAPVGGANEHGSDDEENEEVNLGRLEPGNVDWKEKARLLCTTLDEITGLTRINELNACIQKMEADPDGGTNIHDCVKPQAVVYYNTIENAGFYKGDEREQKMDHMIGHYLHTCNVNIDSEIACAEKDPLNNILIRKLKQSPAPAPPAANQG